MITPKPMSKIRIVGSKKVLRKVINALYEVKLIHLLDYTGRDFFEIGTPFEETKQYSGELVKLRSIISFFGLKGKGKVLENLKEAEKKFSRIEEKFTQLSLELNALKEKEKALKQNQEIALPLKKLKLKSSMLKGYKSIAVFKGLVKKDIEKELAEIKDFELFKAEHEGREVIALFVPVKLREKAALILAEAGFTELNEAQEEFNDIKTELSTATEARKKAEKQLEELKKENSSFLLDLEENLRRENEKSEAPLRFATSMNAFIVTGWIPKEKTKKLNEKVMNETGGKVFVEELKETEGAPTELENPKIIEPFEFFLRLYSLPKYNEIDPSFLIFITFPLFFGFMLGDIGYGIVTLFLFWFLKKKIKGEMGVLLNVMMIASLASILFGFIFGEFFGFEISEHPLLNRAKDIYLMLGISILVGVIHITLGFIVAFYNKLTEHGLKHAVLEKGGWLIMELGAALIALDFMKYCSLGPLGQYIGAGLILLGIIFLYKGEGVKGIIELPSVISNIVSYARLFAIGLSSVALATIINDFAEGFMASGGIFIVLAILTVIGGHTINLMLGILGPFLQSLRLHYVEFFTKFYEGGGEQYSPFGS